MGSDEVRTASDWSVLVVGGASGTGKTTIAKEIARSRGITWGQADDLRLTLQWSDVRLPRDEATDALYYFLRTPDIWSQPEDNLRDALIAVGEVMMEAIAIVIGNHVVQNDPVVIEGDGVLPAILEHPEVHPHVASGAVRMAVLALGSEDALLLDMLARGRGIAETSITPEARRVAAMNWLYTEWLRQEAAKRSIPIVDSEPWESLATRIARSLAQA